MSFIKNASRALNANAHSIQHYAMTLQMEKYFAGIHPHFGWETYVLLLIRHYYKTNNANLSQNHFIILQIMLRQKFWSKRIWVRRGRFGARINVR